VLVMMLVGVVLIPVRASQLYSRLSERYTGWHRLLTHLPLSAAVLWLEERKNVWNKTPGMCGASLQALMLLLALSYPHILSPLQTEER
jgi:hypothetical protein